MISPLVPGMLRAGRMVAMRRPATMQFTRKMQEFNYCVPHMNELPVPAGVFKHHADERYLWYKMWFLIGIVWFGFSGIVMIASGSFNLYATVPELKIEKVDPKELDICYNMNYSGPGPD